ncbi:hypothetical protein PAPHI01_1682 [Pancytospora philotis]|nr:hypothetical protein PAPHI01_1682 [Pancytospora philotis]
MLRPARALFLLSSLCTLYIALLERRLFRLLDDIVDARRRVECGQLLGILRHDIVLVIEKDCNYGIFNSLIPRGGQWAGRPVGVRAQPYSYRRSGAGRAKIIRPFTDRKMQHYILSPRIVPVDGCKCRYLNFMPGDYLDRSVLATFQQAHNKLCGLGLCKVSYGGMQLSRRCRTKYEEHTFRIEEIGSIYYTSYHERNALMEKVGTALKKLTALDKNSISRLEFSTAATNELLGILIRCGILRSPVSLRAYPDLGPLLFPFRFFGSGSDAWTSVNLLSIGFDLRGVLDSELSFLFDKEAVAQLCVDEGVYVAHCVY